VTRVSVRCGAMLAVASFDLAGDGTAWAMDVVGRLWFTTDVSAAQPEGSGLWWQVRLDQTMLLHSNFGHFYIISFPSTCIQFV